MTRTKTQVLRLLVIFLILGILGKEIWQIITVKITVDNAARQLSRYIVTKHYDPELLKTSDVQQRVLLLLENDYTNERVISPEVVSSLIANGQLNDDLQVKEAVIEAAQYYSALNVVNEFKGSLSNPDNLKIVICSDRLGYSYNSVDDKCYPFDDTGESGGISIVSVSYKYKIGSSLGLNLGTYDFHVFKENNNECFLVGCLGSLVVNLDGKVPDKYSMTVIGTHGETRQIECEKGLSTEVPNFGGNDCLVSGARFWSFYPDKFTVTIKWDDGSYSEVFEPIYAVKYPNGPRCGGMCKNSAISIALP